VKNNDININGLVKNIVTICNSIPGRLVNIRPAMGGNINTCSASADGDYQNKKRKRRDEETARSVKKPMVSEFIAQNKFRNQFIIYTI
jgi:hypothetical protein